MPRNRLLLSLLLLTTPLAGQIPAAPTTDAAFKAIYTADAAWRRINRGESDPDEDPHPRVLPFLPKVDPAAQTDRLTHYQQVLQQLDDTIKPATLSPAERLNFEVYRAQIVVLVHQLKFREYEKPANSDSAFWSDLGSGRDSFRNPDEYRNYIAQLNDLPRYFRDQTANMRAGLARGFTPPRVTLTGRDTSIRSVAEAKSLEATSYYKPFLKIPASIPAGQQAELKAQAITAIREKVIPAYAALLAFYDTEYVPQAVTSLAAEDLPDGKAYYQAQILEYTTTTLTPAEIHQIGLDEMAKIHAEMLAVIQQTGFKGDLPAFLQFLRTDPQFYAKTPEELLMRAAYIAKQFDAVAGRYFGYLPRQRFGIRPVPADIAPFYTSARGGASTYLVNTYDLPSRGLYSLPALTLHESAPGHSLQLSIAQEHAQGPNALPRFRNAYISAYGEGWALYCERLGTEMGLYHTPYETFGMLSYQAWRAARLVVDTGIHAHIPGQPSWTRQQAQQYLHENTALSDHEIETEVDRYISWPAQALSYYLGQLAIQRARAKAEAALGPAFNLRAFHDAILETGAVPLPILETHIDAFIANHGIGPYPDMER